MHEVAREASLSTQCFAGPGRRSRIKPDRKKLWHHMKRERLRNVRFFLTGKSFLSYKLALVLICRVAMPPPFDPEPLPPSI